MKENTLETPVQDVKTEISEAFNVVETSKKVKLAEVLTVLKRNGGRVTKTCQDLGISLKTYYKLKKANEESFEEAFNQIELMENDFVYSKLLQMIAKGNTAATIFYLKSKMGWKESQDINIETNTVNIKEAIEEIKQACNAGDK